MKGADGEAPPPILRELSTNPDSGMLGNQLLFGFGGPYVMQYWSSVDKPYAYASSPSQEHRPAWTRPCGGRTAEAQRPSALTHQPEV